MEMKNLLKKYAPLVVLVIALFLGMPLVFLMVYIGITINAVHLYGIADLITTYFLLR